MAASIIPIPVHKAAAIPKQNIEKPIPNANAKVSLRENSTFSNPLISDQKPLLHFLHTPPVFLAVVAKKLSLHFLQWVFSEFIFFTVSRTPE